MTDGAKPRVVVTGAAGFVGFHVAARLLADGAEVLGVDSLNDYYDPALKRARLDRLGPSARFRFERLDLAQADRTLRLFGQFGPSHVVHLAAQAGVRHSLDRPAAYLSANMDGFLSVLEACRRHPVRHLVFASSSSVYGTSTARPYSEHGGADRPVSIYAATKRANELMAHSYAHLFGVPATGLRLFTVYGPWGRPDMAYFSFARAILEGRPIELYRGGHASRDFTYVNDAVDAIEAILERPPPDRERLARHPVSPATAAAPFSIYNLGSGRAVGLEVLVDTLEAALGRRATRLYGPAQPGDVEATQADISDLQAWIGYAPKTGLAEGLRRFVAWYRDWVWAEAQANRQETVPSGP